MKKTSSVYAGMLLSAMLVVVVQPAFGQYDVLDKGSLYDWLEDPANKKEIATNPDAFGSGTPYFAADGIVGASILAGGVFGGIAASFFIRGRKGKYAAMGRG